MLLLALIMFIIVTNINKLLLKIYLISKQTQIIGHKPITPITKLLQKTQSNL